MICNFFLLLALFCTFLGLPFLLSFLWFRRRILADHDPNTPFTADELHRIGIIPPEHYDEWLDEFAKR